MMELLAIEKVNLRPGQHVPSLLEPLIAAVQRREALGPHIVAVVESLGFDSFEYGASATPHPDRNGMTYYFSTLPEWIARYDSEGYIECDPRVFLTCTSAVPLVWDQTNLRKFGAAANRFLDDALEHGIASGVSFMWHGPYDTGMAVTFNSRIPVNSEIRKKAIARNLSDVVMFGHYFHELFMLPALPFGKAPQQPFKPLTARERECLDLGARGMTTRDISLKLAIKSRTVQFHFDRAVVKLGAANRQEAIARAIQTGQVRVR